MAVTQLPRRIPGATSRRVRNLEEVAQGARPLVLARDRSVALDGALAGLVPGGAVVRGTVLRVAGAPGAGSTTVAFELAAAFTALGEWAAAVDLDATLGPLAAAEAGVVLERFAVVRRVPPARWATVVAALLDGVSLVLAEVPRAECAWVTPAGWRHASVNGRRCWSPPSRTGSCGPRVRPTSCTPPPAHGTAWNRARACSPAVACRCGWRAGAGGAPARR